MMARASQVSSEKYSDGLNGVLFCCNQLWNQNMSELEGCSRPSCQSLLGPALCPSREESEGERTWLKSSRDGGKSKVHTVLLPCSDVGEEKMSPHGSLASSLRTTGGRESNRHKSDREERVTQRGPGAFLCEVMRYKD